MDLRYLHHQEIVSRDPSTDRNGNFPLPSFSIVYPGWIDADAHTWAKKLRMPGDCQDLFCACHVRPVSSPGQP